MPRIRTLAVAAIATCAWLVVAVPAQAGKSHLTGLYKVEKHVDLDGEGLDYTISCRPGDIALDGMWRIDNVDQDNDYEPSPPPGFPATGSFLWDNLESVLVDKAQATGPGTYTFSFTPLGGGDVQLKLWLVCLPSPGPATNGHSHTWNVSGLFTETFPVVAGGNAVTPTVACLSSPNQIMVAMGFDWTTGNAHGNIYRRTPVSSALRNYDFGFLSDSTGPEPLVVSWRCLETRSNAAGSPAHKHRLVYYRKNTTQNVKQNLTQTLSVDCGDHYKAIIGTWDFGAFFNYNQLWFLGMDPRPKTRAFRVLNADAADHPADFGVVCLKDRTT